MGQIGIPVDVSLVEIERKPSLGRAIEYCYEAAGFDPKQIEGELKADKGQLSRWKTGGEGIVWPKFTALMDLCGNDAPLLWMNANRGWDLHSMRRRESETERENRMLKEENAALRRVLLGKVAA